MHTLIIRFAIALMLIFAPGTAAHAAGVINIVSCQTLTTPNTVYRLTTDLTSCGDCLVVAADKITIDLQRRSITASTACSGMGAAITDLGTGRDVVVVKNG